MSDLTLRFLKEEKRATHVELLEKSINALKSKLTDLEDCSRRSNLVIFGIPEDPSEKHSDLKQKVLNDLFSVKLEVSCLSVGRIHRLGRNGNPRPVIVYFQDYNEKQTLFKNARKLKGTKISIQNDYSRETLRKRELLWASAKDDRQQGKNVTVINDKLRVNRELVIWDENLRTRVKMPSFHRNSKND